MNHPIAGSVTPDQLIHACCEAPAPGLVSYPCLNGPHSGASVQAPDDASVGTACALRWSTLQKESRYAVYVLIDHNGSRGLMYVNSYTKPDYATAKVQRLNDTCAELMA